MQHKRGQAGRHGKHTLNAVRRIGTTSRDSNSALMPANRRRRRTRRIRVRSVVDGDSVYVKYAGFWSFLRRPFAVRLYAIDAPELAQPYGPEARDQLASLLSRGRFNMEEVANDRYGRRVGLLYRRRRGRQECVNLMMVRSGMAYWYRRYGGADLGFPEAEARAKAERLGVWQGRANRQRPWDYRSELRRNRGRRRARRLVWWILVAAVALALLAVAALAYGAGVWG